METFEEQNTKFQDQITIGIVHICSRIEELSISTPNIYDDKVVITEYLEGWSYVKDYIDSLCTVIGHRTGLIKSPIPIDTKPESADKVVKPKSKKFIIKKKKEEQIDSTWDINYISEEELDLDLELEQEAMNECLPEGRLIFTDKSKVELPIIEDKEKEPITIENIVKKVQEAHIDEPNKSIFSRPESPKENKEEVKEPAKKKDIREVLSELKIRAGIKKPIEKEEYKTVSQLQSEQPSEVEEDDRDTTSNVSSRQSEQESEDDTASVSSNISVVSNSFKEQMENTRKKRTAKIETENTNKRKYMSDAIDNIKKILNYYSSTIKETSHSRNQVINTLIKQIKSLKLKVYQESAMIFEENIKDWIMETIEDPIKYPTLRIKQIYVNKQVRDIISPNIPDKETGRYVNSCFSCWLLNNYLDNYKIIDRFIEIANLAEDKQKEMLTSEYIIQLARYISQVEKARDKCKIAYNIELLVE